MWQVKPFLSGIDEKGNMSFQNRKRYFTIDSFHLSGFNATTNTIDEKILHTSPNNLWSIWYTSSHRFHPSKSEQLLYIRINSPRSSAQWTAFSHDSLSLRYDNDDAAAPMTRSLCQRREPFGRQRVSWRQSKGPESLCAKPAVDLNPVLY